MMPPWRAKAHHFCSEPFSQHVAHVQLQSSAEMPQSDEASVNVLILAGGFNTRFMDDVRAKAAADTLRKDPTTNIIRRTKARSALRAFGCTECVAMPHSSADRVSN
jgi:hypothetical protein